MEVCNEFDVLHSDKHKLATEVTLISRFSDPWTHKWRLWITCWNSNLQYIERDTHIIYSVQQ